MPDWPYLTTRGRPAPRSRSRRTAWPRIRQACADRWSRRDRSSRRRFTSGGSVTPPAPAGPARSGRRARSRRAGRSSGHRSSSRTPGRSRCPAARDGSAPLIDRDPQAGLLNEFARGGLRDARSRLHPASRESPATGPSGDEQHALSSVTEDHLHHRRRTVPRPTLASSPTSRPHASFATSRNRLPAVLHASNTHPRPRSGGRFATIVHYDGRRMGRQLATSDA